MGHDFRRHLIARPDQARWTWVPSIRFSFTGMRTTRFDGSTSYYARGLPPTIRAAPTIAGFRAGRDEVLERALEVVRGQ